LINRINTLMCYKLVFIAGIRRAKI